MEHCMICPRKCGVPRRGEAGTGFCRMGEELKIARAAAHLWEEPVISGDRGSGTVFFSGCTLKCVFCQNREISAGGFGRIVTEDRLREIYKELIDRGVHNINLVSPTQFTPMIVRSLQPKPPVPIVWNTGGYERVETLKCLEGLVDIYLPDLKYDDPTLAARYSGAADYPEIAKKAILEMFRQTGPYQLDENGMLRKGTVIRHLVLPEQLENTFRVIDWVEKTFSHGDIFFSLMSQFTPTEGCRAYPELNRPLSQSEHDAACRYLMASDIEDGFTQDLGSVGESFIPPFDLTGV